MPSVVAVDADTSAAGRPVGPDLVKDICLGLELKFLLLGLPNAEGGPATHEVQANRDPVNRDAVQRQAYSALAQTIVRSTGSSFDKITTRIGMSLVQPRAISKYEISEAGLAERDFWASHWIVKKANSVEHVAEDPRPDSDSTNGVAVSVELNSPKLAWKDPLMPFHVAKVLSRVNTFPTWVNYTCDLHVHVGRCDGAAFTLPTLKKLATVFWLAEPILRSVRDPHSPNYGNHYTWGFEQRRYSRLALALERRTSPTDPVTIGEDVLLRVRAGSGQSADEADWHQHMNDIGHEAIPNEALCAIWLASSKQELGQLLSGSQREHRRLGFNFSAFGGEDERARTNPRTIEFRILEGTLQSDMVQGWLQICGKLVELGMKGRQSKFRDVVRYLVSQQAAYEDFEAQGQFGHVQEHPEHMKRPSRDVLFAEFMKCIGVDSASYRPFQEKIRQEYGSA